MKGKCLNLPINQLLYIFFIIFFHIYKNLSANYYPEHKERLQKEACQSIQNLSKEEKEKKQLYAHEHCKNPSEHEKHKMDEYWKKIL